MGAYNFQAQFEPAIVSGRKRHTIRGRRRHEDQLGATFHGFVGMRTSACRKIIEAPYIKHEPIVIEPPTGLIELAGVRLSLDERQVLAFADGFADLATMLSFWQGTKRFEGLIHYWDFDRRVMPEC